MGALPASMDNTPITRWLGSNECLPGSHHCCPLLTRTQSSGDPCHGNSGRVSLGVFYPTCPDRPRRLMTVWADTVRCPYTADAV